VGAGLDLCKANMDRCGLLKTTEEAIGSKASCTKYIQMIQMEVSFGSAGIKSGCILRET
jgi:hypothetical protein